MNTPMPRMIPVMTGRVCAGFLIRQARGIEAYDHAERLIGTFPDVITAAAAVEKSAVPACPKCSE
jgi:hypothetical protein